MTRLSDTAERRIAPRVETSFSAELASGTVLVPVMLRDLSASGCGVVIVSGDRDLPSKLGARGILHIRALDRGTSGTILPVALRNVRSDESRMIYGLKFGPLLPHQTRKLQAILEAMSQTK